MTYLTGAQGFLQRLGVIYGYMIVISAWNVLVSDWLLFPRIKKIIDEAITEHVDYLFIGGGLYVKRHNEAIKTFLESTDLSLVGEIVPFATCNEFSNVIKQIRKFCKNNNVKCSEEDLCIKWVLEGMLDIGFRGAEFAPELIERIKGFARKFKETS